MVPVAYSDDSAKLKNPCAIRMGINNGTWSKKVQLRNPTFKNIHAYKTAEIEHFLDFLYGRKFSPLLRISKKTIFFLWSAHAPGRVFLGETLIPILGRNIIK